MHDIVRIEFVEGEAVVSHEQLAEGLKIKAKNVRELLQKHHSDFEQFGVLTFETDKPLEDSLGGRPSKVYYLNEQQATLALTYFRNSDTVRAFKVALVKSFFKMRSQLQGGQSQTFDRAFEAIARSQEQMAQGFEAMSQSVKILADGQREIVELVKQLQSNTPVRLEKGKGINDRQKEMLVCVNPEFHDNPEERQMFTMNVVSILKVYPAGLSQGALLSKSDYPESTRTRRWLQDGVGAFWNMQIKPGRGYLYFL